MMKMSMKITAKCSSLIGLMVVCLSIAPFDASAGGGDSWKRHIHNNSNQAVSLSVNAGNGNIWFESGCPGTNPNGPCTMSPNSTAEITYTTTHGGADGTFIIGSCQNGYQAGGGVLGYQPIFNTGSCQTNGLSIKYDTPDRGDITINN